MFTVWNKTKEVFNRLINKVKQICPIEFVDGVKKFYTWATAQLGGLLIFTEVAYSYLPMIHAYVSEGVAGALGTIIILLRVMQLKEAPRNRRR